MSSQLQVVDTAPIAASCRIVGHDVSGMLAMGLGVEGSNGMKPLEDEKPEIVERRMQDGLMKALHTPAKPNAASKEKRFESHSK